jgi:hypothetical protein
MAMCVCVIICKLFLLFEKFLKNRHVKDKPLLPVSMRVFTDSAYIVMPFALA